MGPNDSDIIIRSFSIDVWGVPPRIVLCVEDVLLLGVFSCTTCNWTWIHYKYTHVHASVHIVHSSYMSTQQTYTCTYVSMYTYMYMCMTCMYVHVYDKHVVHTWLTQLRSTKHITNCYQPLKNYVIAPSGETHNQHIPDECSTKWASKAAQLAEFKPPIKYTWGQSKTNW